MPAGLVKTPEELLVAFDLEFIIAHYGSLQGESANSNARRCAGDHPIRNWPQQSCATVRTQQQGDSKRRQRM
jgi:hypothetical protein